MIRYGAALVLLMASMPGAAAPPKPGEPGWDPNRQVCKSRSVVGSRLKRIRECHSAEQWEELKFMERQGLMRQQFNGSPGCPEAIGCNAVPRRDSPL